MHHITFLVPSARDVHLRYEALSSEGIQKTRTLVVPYVVLFITADMVRIDATWISDVSGKHHHAALNILWVP